MFGIIRGVSVYSSSRFKVVKMEYSVDPKDVLRFQLDRNVRLLFREQLMLLEDLGKEHDTALSKLNDALPEQYRHYLDLADYLTPDRGQQLRKRVLDRGNDVLRNFEELLKQFEIRFK